MSNRHATPPDIAKALARHAPKSAKRILDPSVGDGSLLLPLLDRIRHSRCEVTGIDTDAAAIRTTNLRLASYSVARRELIHSDFLAWTMSRPSDARFDCVIANPPFAARRGDWVAVNRCHPWLERAMDSTLCAVEVAFIMACVDALEPGGRLLSIVPSSVVASVNCNWLRRSLFAQGSIRLVHELPRYTFSGVESRFYFLVFDKCIKAKRFVLCNHDLHRPDRLVMCRSNLDPQLRLDYSFHESSSKYAHHLQAKRLGWKSLGDIASLQRGGERSPHLWPLVIHTNHYRSGFWRAHHDQAIDANANQFRIIERNDLLIKRVGRNCSQSLGSTVGITARSCSDCVLMVRPFATIERIRLLFALRCLLNATWARALVERGTGASYLSQESFERLRVPLDLSEQLPCHFQAYQRAHRLRNFAKMREIEVLVCKHLGW
jgi:SAM-dependent methyltransferase